VGEERKRYKEMQATTEPTLSRNESVRYMDVHWLAQQHVLSVYL